MPSLDSHQFGAASRFRLVYWSLVIGLVSGMPAIVLAQHSTYYSNPSGEVTPGYPDSLVAEIPQETPVIWEPRIQLDTLTTGHMFDFQNRQSDKQLAIIESQSDSDTFPRLIVGGQLRASAMAATTNTANKFAYLGRFPPDFVGTSATDARLLQANAGVILHAAPGVSGYLELLFSDVFSFPTFNQGSLQMRQAYLVLGDFEVTPFYAFIGKKNVTFGDFRTLSPFTQAVPWHYFAPLAEGIGGGYSDGGWNLTVMALNGSRGIRVADSESKGTLNNFSANGSYTLSLDADTDFIVGAGYLHGTIYDSTVAEHINPAITGERNGAWDVNGRIRMGNAYASGEYVQTINDWPVVSAPVQAYKTELGLDLPGMPVPTFVSASWSQGIQGDSGTTFRSNSQLVLGTQFKIHENVQLSFEYIRSLGFAPLLNITTVSDPDVIQNTYLLGLVVKI
ncbi:MAG: hypothetical protein DWH91_14720 [Planctomycetota bacterium]|nr:MAG: hypothetical protein DWH91_14720 [Planctomycetota bacterium]